MKPKDPVWNFFIIIDEGNKKIAKCINCDSVVSSKVERLKAHFQENIEILFFMYMVPTTYFLRCLFKS